MLFEFVVMFDLNTGKIEAHKENKVFIRMGLIARTNDLD